MQASVIITLCVTAILAITGYLVTYLTNLRLARRRDRLERINQQLGSFYGPLYALLEAGQQAWEAFEAQPTIWAERGVFTDEGAVTWRRWMLHAFAPINRQMMEIIINRSDLLNESSLPKCFQDLCAHVICYEPVLAKWQEDGFSSVLESDNSSVNYFPRDALESHIRQSFEALKREQMRLLGTAR